MSIALVATPRSAMPSAMRGVGSSMRARTASKSPVERDGRETPPAPAAHRPSVPLTHSSSPTRAPERNSACPTGTSPNTAMQMLSGPAVVSPPTTSMPCSSASANRPRAKPSRKTSSTRGIASASVNASGAAPQAARSDRFTASALWPSRSGATVERKCRPSTSMSVETASCLPGEAAAAHSRRRRRARRDWRGRGKPALRSRSNSPIDIESSRRRY